MRFAPLRDLMSDSPFAAIPISSGLLVSGLLSFELGVVVTLSRMMFSSAALDCKRFPYVSDFAETAPAFVDLMGERTQDVMKVLHVLGAASVAKVADVRRIC